MKKNINPFNITKAVDYTDEELNVFWVDFPQKSGFSGIIKPTSDMPMIILGSKGSGKTHIMKHFSYTAQSIRHSNDILKGLKEDGYLGIYLRCSGLNGFKFKGKEETEDTWQNIFAYYLELWLSQLLLNCIVKIIESSNLDVKDEHILTLEILDLLDANGLPNSIKSFTHIIKYFNELQKEIDYSINNKAFTNKKISESVEILASPGSLIFGIPQILSEKISAFEGIKFLYLLDEYENFTDDQQRYFNTLIRERKNPTCFKIGARRYGIRTYETLSANEEIKAGSEYEEFDIDSIFRSEKDVYKKFIRQICVKRLEKLSIKINADSLDDYFESFNIEEFLIRIQRGDKGHLKELQSKLNNNKLKSLSNKIVRNLVFEKDALLERINVLLFYREWKNGSDLISASEKISVSCIKYYNERIENEHFKILDKFKYDLLDNLARENGEKVVSNVGFDNLVKMSSGIPRHFLIIMKHIFKWNDYFDKSTFKSTKINIETQLNAINDTAKWFIEDARIPGDEGNNVKDSLERLCDYLRELRFSDIPPECSISSFSIKSKHIPPSIQRTLDFLEQYSYIIRVSSRRDKNSNSRNITFQINGLIATYWELSLSRRGIIDLNVNNTRSIFAPNNDNDFKNTLTQELLKYNAPFKATQYPSLFEQD